MVTEGKKISSMAVILSVVIVMAAVGRQGARAQSECNSALVSLSPCLNYITGNETTPSQGCCGALATVVKNNASCLCQLVSGNNQLGIAINQTRALALPGECKVSTPPVSRCQGSGAPTASPSSTTPTGQATPGSNPSANKSASGSLMCGFINAVSGMVIAALLI